MSEASNKSWILNEVGFCHMSLGRLDTAVPFYERKVARNVELEQWEAASTGYQNLASLNAKLGRLDASAAAATRALELARRAANKGDERNSLKTQAWAAHLRGEVDAAGESFRQAEALEREIDSSKQYLYSLRGIQHAEYLLRMGEAGYARRVTDANLGILTRLRASHQISMCQRVLGELDAADGQDEAARTHFDTALSIARGISHRPALIEALLARGGLGGAIPR